MASNELFDLKTAFFLGNFNQAINEAQKVKVSLHPRDLSLKYYIFHLVIKIRVQILISKRKRMFTCTVHTLPKRNTV